ncbi:MAG TPA: PAS domain S-box protein [Gemmataceae bacterium]|nr:PAS domain S-box protein [Gemmataceae bacterium]
MTKKTPSLDQGPPGMSGKAEELREQNEWLRVILASIGDAVMTTDSNGCITFLNPVAQSLTGWKQEEAAGQLLNSVFRIINEESRQPVENPTIRALRDGVVVGLANRTLLIAKDGTERPIDDSAAPIRDEQAEVAGVVLVFRDITERRRQEQAVQDALNYAENIIATLREPFLVLDKNLRVKTANRAFYRHFHVLKEETENQLFYELNDGQWDIPALRKLLEEVLPHKQAFQDFEVEHIFPEIGRRTLLLNARCFEPQNGRPELILLVFEDITERRLSDVALQISEVRYRRLFETAKDGILILDARTGKITEANPFMTGLLSLPHDELLGKELWEIGVFSDISENQTAFRELQAKGYIRYAHLPLETRQKQKVEVEFVSNVYEVDHRKVIQCNIRDISDRARLERITQQQAATLADLHRRKDEFLAMLSHELRNPLAPILNAVHLLRLQGNENLIQHQARVIIERQVGQLSRLVDDLLEVSRIATGRVRLHQERLDLRGVVERAVEAVRPLIDRRRHELSLSLPPEPVWLHGDPNRLEQVVVNLLNNSCKYTDEGGRIGLTVCQEEDKVVLRMQDTGIGIAADLLPHIFDLFTQADRSLDRSQGGLGIGLALVQRLVELHGGTVQAFSAGIGRGSEFVVRLPVPPQGTTTQNQDDEARAHQPAPSYRVLVVEDNVDAAESMALLMRMSSHDVRVAHTGPDGLEVAVAFRPQIVLMDIGLPGMDGYEVARRLRQHADLKGVRLIALTGYGRESDLQRSQEAGFDHHLVKPVNPLKLLELLATLTVEPQPVE